MAGRAFVMGIGVGAMLALFSAWLLWGKGRTEQPRPPAVAAHEAPADAAAAEDPRHGAAAGAPSSARPAALASRDAPAASPVVPASTPRPEEGPDGASWRRAKLAFGMRELGRMGPYVKLGLDAARREMAFCFSKQASAAQAPAPDGDADAPPPAPDPAVLLLYLEAREGALDVVDARTDHLGATSLEVVDCCREVLRGWEIPAFKTAPGQRYRVKFELQ
jgi:hypothetical protein